MKKAFFGFLVIGIVSLSTLGVYAQASRIDPAIDLEAYLNELKRLRIEQYKKNAMQGNPAVLGASMDRQPPALGIYKTVRFGQSNSEDVRRLQRFLIAKGYLKAEASGNFLTQTKLALKKFQIEYAIVGGDGMIAGPKTNAKIMALSQ